MSRTKLKICALVGVIVGSVWAYWGWISFNDDDWLGVLLYCFGTVLMFSVSSQFFRRLRSDTEND